MKAEAVARITLTVKPENFDKAIKFFSELFETEFPEIPEEAFAESFYGQKETTDERIGIDICTAITPDGKTAQRLAKRGEGMDVVAITVKPEDYDKAVEEVKARGIRIVDQGETPWWRYFTLHPKDTFGTMIEITDNATRTRH